MLRTIRNIILSVVVLVSLFAAVGVGYVLLSGNSSGEAKSTQAPTAAPPDTGLPRPHAPSPDAPEGAAVESLLSPAAAGSNTSISVKTNAGSVCTISVTYNNVPSKDSGLTPKTTDVYGNVSWTWTIDKTAPVGIWPVKVTCVFNKKTGVVVGNLQVTK